MIIPIDKVEPGVEVLSDVFNVNKALVVPKGALLTERHIKVLKMWGVESVNVAVEGADGSQTAAQPTLTPEALSAAEARVKERFKHVAPGFPATEIIRRLAIKHAAGHLLRERESRAGDNG